MKCSFATNISIFSSDKICAARAGLEEALSENAFEYMIIRELIIELILTYKKCYHTLEKTFHVVCGSI